MIVLISAMIVLEPETKLFLWGFGGSLAAELVLLLQHFDAHPFSLPERYSKPLFWIARSLLAIAAGFLPIGYKIAADQYLLAANLGASAPLIIHSLARGVRVAEQGRPVPKQDRRN